MNPHLTPMQLPQDQGCPLLTTKMSSTIMVVGKCRKKFEKKKIFLKKRITIRVAILSPDVTNVKKMSYVFLSHFKKNPNGSGNRYRNY